MLQIKLLPLMIGLLAPQINKSVDPMELQISMIPSPEDPPLGSAEYQSELRMLGLGLKQSGLEIRDSSTRRLDVESQLPMIGEWWIKVEPQAAALLGTTVFSWLQARRGRTARLKIGEVEVDVRTVEELAAVIQVANRYQTICEMDS